jgi:hypothetical protein
MCDPTCSRGDFEMCDPTSSRGDFEMCDPTCSRGIRTVSDWNQDEVVGALRHQVGSNLYFLLFSQKNQEWEALLLNRNLEHCK